MKALTPRRFWLGLLALAGVALVAVAVGLFFGAEPITGEGAARGERAAFILLSIRAPRVLAGLFVGGALAACGAAFQALLRNPLASPFILGVSGGGSLGAVLAILAGLSSVTVLGVPVSTRPVFAFAGCLLALVAIFAIANRRGHLAPQTLLLAGVVANAFFLSILGYLNFRASPRQAQEILRWMMGGLYGQTMGGALVTGALTVGGGVWLTLAGRDLNVVSLGEESAARLGVPANRVRRRVFLLASLLTGAAVAVSGPIGFVGLFVPHGVRLIWGADHRLVVPASWLAGGAFLVLADTLARVASAPEEMPVGLVTAAIGAPCFIVLLVRAGRAGGEAS